MTAGARGPGVRVPPPVILALALGLAWGLQEVAPVQVGPPLIGLGAMLFVVGVGWVAWALVILIRAGNNPRPDRPDARFVEAGPFLWGRNPIYFGAVCCLAGVALVWGTLWAWLAVVVAYVALDRLVIRREEVSLRARFPEEYPDYARRIRRWV